ncbi:MAG TPA: hypothetical protein VFQ58_08890 [Flavisolibacter sp.]|nr:hypothetical protein [Flavisolibacter sp.]
MKRLLITLTFAFTLISMSSFADSTTVSPAVLNSFKSSFKNASEVNWSSTANYYKANFILNSQYISAYYDMDGKMIALTRNISSLQLPLSLQTELKTKNEKYWISDLFEVANDQGNYYYATFENADEQIVMKSSGSTWTIYKKQRKA